MLLFKSNKNVILVLESVLVYPLETYAVVILFIFGPGV